jgi:hypothetical protein
VINPVNPSASQAFVAALEEAAKKTPENRKVVMLLQAASRYIGETEKRLAALEAKS